MSARTRVWIGKHRKNGMNMQPDLLLLTPKVSFAPEPVKAIQSALRAALTEPGIKRKERFTIESS